MMKYLEMNIKSKTFLTKPLRYDWKQIHEKLNQI